MTREAIELSKPSVEIPKVIWRRKTAADIFYGDKILMLRFDTLLNRIITKVWSRPHFSKVFGSTTSVYCEALRLMEMFVTKHQEPMEYTFTTLDPNLRAWALDPGKGRGLFNWSDEDIEDNGETLIAKRMIHPNPI